MDRFDAMTAFVRVVETGSFTRAAATLDISRTSATQLVQQLEARLRVKLLNRTTRKVNVTADGAAYYERVVRLLADLDDTESVLSHASAQPKGKLKVDVPSPLARMILMPALPAFHARYPDLQIDMGVSDRTIDLIGESVDCVIRGGELRDLSLKARHVGDLQLGLYAAPAYLARHATPAHPRELEHGAHRVVGFLWDAPARPIRCCCAAAARRSPSTANTWSPSTTATPIWRPGWPAWACCGCRAIWPSPMWPAANCCRCWRTGAWPPCRCTWRIRRTATSAPGCACSSTGWPI